MSKYTDKRIEEITSLVTKDIPAAINNGISVDEYLNKYRMTLNLTIIQAIFGAEFEKPKKEGKNAKIKFNHKRADVGDLAIICRLLNDFIGNVESPFLSQNAGGDCFSNAGDDMAIPDRIATAPALPELEKVNNKKIYNYIFGSDGRAAISKMMLTGMDVYDLATVAKKIKKVKTRNTMLLIGGIALVVTGGTVATVCFINNKKKHKADAEGDVPDVDLDDIDVDDIDVGDAGMDDVPNVELPD